MSNPIEDFILTYPPAIQAISRELRVMVQGALPHANELLFASQNHFSYSLNLSSSGTVCYICPMKDYVRLGFMYGAAIPDPHKMLEGEGIRLRHVKVRSLEATHYPALPLLVEAPGLRRSPNAKRNNRNQPSTPIALGRKYRLTSKLITHSSSAPTCLSTSATLQAWLMQPLGVCGSSPSKISLMLPSPAVPRCALSAGSILSGIPSRRIIALHSPHCVEVRPQQPRPHSALVISPIPCSPVPIAAALILPIIRP